MCIQLGNIRLKLQLPGILWNHFLCMAAPPPSNGADNTVIFDLDAPSFSSDHFRMFEFKVKRCPRVKPHDWACCPFSHANEKAKRRDPRLCKYSGTACPEFRRNGCCRRSDLCPFAHGIFECWMHPSRYRTQMCSEVLECKRRVCFFAHTESEMRRPVDDATWMRDHGSFCMDAEGLEVNHISKEPSSGKTTVPVLTPTSSSPSLDGEAKDMNSDMPRLAKDETGITSAEQDELNSVLALVQELDVQKA